MNPFLSALIISVTVLAIVLAGDLGRRRVTAWRLARPVIAVVAVVAIFVHALPHVGNDLALQAVGTVVGLLLGALSAGLLRTGHDEQGAYTVGGGAYAAFWIVVFAARMLFAYGSEHWFADALVRFCIAYQVSGADALTNTLVFLSLAMVLARTAVIVGRTRSARVGSAAA
jgi:hypothetical protein